MAGDIAVASNPVAARTTEAAYAAALEIAAGRHIVSLMELGVAADLVANSIRRLILQQWQLATLYVGERTITSHLFRHMADAFENTGFHVDHEYNRHGLLPKYLAFGTGDDEGVQRIYPDIVVHRRNSDDANLIAVEVKKGHTNDSNDRDKIRGLVTDEAYRYRWGVLLSLGIQTNHGSWAPSWEWCMVGGDDLGLTTMWHQPVFAAEELEHLNFEGMNLM